MNPTSGQAVDYLVYLHGFRSSPRSAKALLVLDWAKRLGFAEQLWVPHLPVSPAQAMAMLCEHVDRLLANNQPIQLGWMGSSLGGYYATAMAERYGGKAVLLNPAITPYDDLIRHVGKQTIYFSNEEIEFLPAYLDELRAIDCPSITDAGRYYLLACMGDEVLDARQMIKKYAGAHQKVLPGGDHAISNFAEYLPEVMQFIAWGGLA
jgi:hypothetical protein